MTNQKELLSFIWDQAQIYPEPLKPKDFRAKLNEWKKKGQTI